MYGTPQDVLDRVVTVAFGRNKHDKNWRNQTGTFGGLLPVLTTFKHGEKDGLCVTQGKLVGAQRQSKDVLQNDLMMFDCDTGAGLGDVYDKLEKSGYFALMWTTYSHMKPSTDITESEIIRYRKTAQIDADALDITVCRQYLGDVKKVEPWLLETITHVEREHKEGGVMFVVHHDPMPRCRILFVLEQPYVFAQRGGTQAEAIQEWKERYAGMSDQLGLAYDTKCVDPARLMYTPRIPEGAAGEFWIIPGAMVPIDAIPRVGKGTNDDNPFVAMGTERVTTGTPGLMKFVAEHGSDFRAAACFGTMFPDDVRPGGDGDKINFRCPNEDGHSVISPDDSGFMIVDGDGVTGFRLLCQHTTCGHESNNDRVWFLDRLCQHYGVSVDDLLLYCPEYETRQEETKKAEENTAEQVHGLTPESTPAEIEAALDAVVARKLSGPAVLSTLRTMCEKTGEKFNARNETKWKNFYKERVAIATANGTAVADHAPVPANGANCTQIWAHWPASDAARILTERIAAQNNKEPTLFRMTGDGSAVRLYRDKGRVKLEPLLAREQWSVEIGKRVKFMRYNEDKGTETEVHPPDWSVTHMRGGGANAALLPLERIMKVPVFSAEGVLLTTAGYHHSTQIYLDPPIEFDYCPPPGEITWEHVEWAREEIFEVLRDFPFSDAYDGIEALPVRDYKRFDKLGRPLPTWGRGTASYAHTVAMMIQPFIKKMIPGSFPMYFIDKSVPGTGAGLLMDVISYVFTGTTAPVQTLQAGNNAEDEFRKRVTAMLLGGVDIMFFDNVNHDVKSAALAAALTGGKWTDRLLGSSTQIEIEIDCVWAIAGNNVGFAGELVRRLIPIRMDAEVPDPARDRPPTWYTHGDLVGGGYLEQHRVDLVQAVHILVTWWIQNGAKWATHETLASFGGWSGVLGGILRDAGIDGFLSARDAFSATRNGQIGAASAVIETLYAKFRNQRFMVADAITELNTPNIVTGVCPLDDIEQIARARGDDNLLRAAFGRWMSKEAVGKTFVIVDADGNRSYIKPVRADKSVGSGYRLAPIVVPT